MIPPQKSKVIRNSSVVHDNAREVRYINYHDSCARKNVDTMLGLGEVFQKIVDIEDKLRLFEATIDGVRFWEYVRAPLIQSIHEYTLRQRGHFGKGPTLFKRMKYLIFSFAKIWKNPIFSRRKDIVFISSPRRVLKKDGYWWDIYTDFLMENLNLSYTAIEHNINFEHRNPPKTRNLWYFDFQNSLIYLAEKLGLFQVSLNNDDKILLYKIRKQITQSIGLDIDVQKIAERHLGYRKIRIPYFRFVLKRIRPKVIVLLTSYGKEDLIEPAKSLHIPVIELQHGVINRYHPGYSFPKKKHQKTTFPDLLFTFGDYWSESVEYPIDDKDVVSVGYPYLDEERIMYSKLKKKKQILVISQWTIGEDISKFTAELSKVKDLGYDIIYKLHPSEYTDWQTKYPWLVGTGVKVIHDSKKSLYKLFAESEIQIGVYSTAVFEGLAFGLQTYIPDLYGAETTEGLVKEGVAVKVASAEELVNHLRSKKKLEKLDIERFFRSGARERILKLISEIVSKK